MKKLKLIGVLLVSLLLPVLVNAEEKLCVAKIDDVCYESLELAYEDVKYNENEFVAGKTIVLQDDINLREIGYNPNNPMIFDFTDNVTLDLNEHFIKARGNSVFYQGNNLTIKNGTFKTEYFGNGNISQDDSYPLHIGYERETSNIVLDNLTINGGVNVYNTKKVRIKNSNVTGNQAYYGVWADNYAEIIIESGNYKTLSKNGIIGMASTKEKEGSVTVLGGTFTIGEGKLFCTSTSCLSGKGFIQGGTFDKNVEDLLPNENYRVEENDGEFVVQKKLNVLVGLIEGDGDIRFDKELAFPGEEITMTYFPLEGFEFESVEVLDENNNKIEVKNNKFVMPNTDAWIKVIFKPIQKVETPVIDKENNVGISSVEKTEDVLLKTLAKNDKYKDLSVTVEVLVEDVKVSDEVDKEFVAALDKKEVKSGKIVSYFDITIAVKNIVTKKVEGNLTELTEKIEFTVALPELEKVKEGFVRKYFIIKKHNDKVEVIDAILSKDGKNITFETSEFSTYALAYEDSEKVEDKVEENVEENVEVPKTFDGISLTLLISFVSIISLVGINLYFKKQLNKN